MSDTATLQKQYHPVHRPAHYDLGDGIEVIDVIEDVFGIAGHLPQALAYVMRAGKKGRSRQDYAKALWYVRRARRRNMHWEASGVHVLSVAVEHALRQQQDGVHGQAVDALVRAAMANRIGIWLHHLNIAERALAELSGEAV